MIYHDILLHKMIYNYYYNITFEVGVYYFTALNTNHVTIVLYPVLYYNNDLKLLWI